MNDFEEEKLTPEQVARLEADAKLPQPERTEAERLAPFKDENCYLHIYGQSQWHGEAFIVANKQALLMLKKAIEDAVANGHGFISAFQGDGEGYNTLIARVDNPQDFDRLANSYTEEIASDKREDAIWPWDMGSIRKANEDSQEWLEEKYSKEEE